MSIHVYSNWKMNFDSKNGKKICFSFETKASISFIPMKRMCLWYPIMKRIEIILWVRICPNRWTNFNSKNGRKRSFSYENKASISFILIRRMCLGAQSWKENRLLRESMFIPIDRRTLILKNSGKWSFSYETKASIHLSHWGEWICGTQSLKDRRLLCKFEFIQLKNKL